MREKITATAATSTLPEAINSFNTNHLAQNPANGGTPASEKITTIEIKLTYKVLDNKHSGNNSGQNASKKVAPRKIASGAAAKGTSTKSKTLMFNAFDF